MKLNAKIIAERERLKLTQGALGQKVGVSKVTISRWETGRDVPRFKHVESLAKIFGRPLAWFSDEEITGEEIQGAREKGAQEVRMKMKSLANEARQFLQRSLKAIEEMSRLL